MIAKREYSASWVCMFGFVPNWLSVSVLRSSVCVVSLVMRRLSKSLARESLRYMPLDALGGIYDLCGASHS